MIRNRNAHTLLLSLLLGTTSVFQAQNLVPNPGFEEFRNCPSQLGTFDADVAIWTCPTQGSTDFFHHCSQKMSAPENFNGAQSTFEGKGYAGFYAYAPGNYREYLQVPLKEPLKAGASYSLSFHVSLAERSDYAIRDLGVLFSSHELSVPTKQFLSRKYWYAYPENKYHFLEVSQPGLFSETEGWVRVEARFEAEGTERYLILGNFRENRQTLKKPTGKSSNKGAYYYIDMVELRAVEGKGPLASATEGYQLDTLHVFSSVLFEFDTFSLSGLGQTELDSLYRFLSADPDLRLELGGHTDATGSPSYNQRLSERRCRAVADYLEGLGMDAGRIQWTGFGASRPVASNDTEAGRSRNRRVEFRILRTEALLAYPEN